MDMCDRGIDFVFVSMIRQLDFGSVHTVWYILGFFSFYTCYRCIHSEITLCIIYIPCAYIFIFKLHFPVLLRFCLLYFGTVPTVWYLFFILLSLKDFV